MATFTWRITQLQRHLADGCVFQVEYSVTASQDGFTSQWTGCLDLPRPEGSMIPFSALTEELVIGWVQEALGSEKLIALILGTLQDGIESQRHVTTGTGLPWLMEHPDETVLVRARNELGQYVGDDPNTSENEAWTEVPLEDA